nr:NAD-dependent epimerase/dehydratase family protein [Dawidia cretensis]
MKILLTGSTGYIGRRLLPVLLDAGHTVVCFVRQRRKLASMLLRLCNDSRSR